MPILFKNDFVHGFEIFNLEQCETILVEPMHGIGRHNTNLCDELPEHLNKNDKQLLLQTTWTYKRQKEILRNVGKRKMLLYVIASFYGKVTNKVILL